MRLRYLLLIVSISVPGFLPLLIHVFCFVGIGLHSVVASQYLLISNFNVQLHPKSSQHSMPSNTNSNNSDRLQPTGLRLTFLSNPSPPTTQLCCSTLNVS